ncbi:MAG: type II glyceraldehyde-3-phosphate dehydrogenase, partial [Marinobacter sp.]
MVGQRIIRVAVNGYGVIGKRVAQAVAVQKDMAVAGVADVAQDWRVRAALSRGYALYGATEEHAVAMGAAGLDVSGTLDDLLEAADIVVDCTPKRLASKNIETYRRLGIKYIVHGGEKHGSTGHSF